MLSRICYLQYRSRIIQEIERNFLRIIASQKERLRFYSWSSMGSEMAIDDKLNLITRNLQVNL